MLTSIALETGNCNCFIFFRAYYPTMCLVHCGVIWTVWKVSLKWWPFIQILFRPILRNYTWQLFNIFRVDQSDMEPVQGQVILTFWPSVLIIWPSKSNFVQTMILTILSSPLLRNYKWQLLHLFNLTWDFGPEVIQPFDLEMMTVDWNLFVQILSMPVDPFAMIDSWALLLW